MNPQEPDSQSTQQSTQPQQPQPPAEPAASDAPSAPTAPLPPPSVAPATASPVPGMAPAKKSHKLLIIGIAVAAVVVLILIVSFVLVGMPAVQSHALSDKFMDAMTTGKVSDAVKLTDDSSATAFLTSIAPSVKGSYKLSQSKYDNGTGYYLYTLTGAKDKYARTVVELKNGTNLVDSFVADTTALKLVPGSTSSLNSSASTPQTTATATSSDCLQKSDFYDLENAISDGFGHDSVDYSTYQTSLPFGAMFPFLPNSLNFDPQDNNEMYTNEYKVQAFANFYNATPTKDYTFHLEGVVATTASADLSFGTQRSQKVASMLESEGVPSSKIVIEPSQNIATYEGDLNNGQLNDPGAQRDARSVFISVVPGNCSADAAGSSSAGK